MIEKDVVCVAAGHLPVRKALDRDAALIDLHKSAKAVPFHLVSVTVMVGRERAPSNQHGLNHRRRHPPIFRPPESRHRLRHLHLTPQSAGAGLLQQCRPPAR
jgi:hypothetical protein